MRMLRILKAIRSVLICLVALLFACSFGLSCAALVHGKVTYWDLSMLGGLGCGFLAALIVASTKYGLSWWLVAQSVVVAVPGTVVTAVIPSVFHMSLGATIPFDVMVGGAISIAVLLDAIARHEREGTN